MPRIRAGVVGVGHLGYHHARNYAALPEADLAGVADADPARAAKAGNDFNAPAFQTVDELLALGIDAASVVVPTSMHCEVAGKLLEAGVDVLVEKPMASTVNEARRLDQLAAGGNRVLQVGHIERFNGAVEAMFGAIRQPRFIECHRLSPYPGRGADVSVVLDLMIHDLEIVLALVGERVDSVDAVGVSVFSKEEDIANARIRFKSGCVANLTASRISMETMRKIRVFESDAYLSTDYSAREVKVYRKRDGDPAVTSPMDLISVEDLQVHKDEPLKRELQAFLHCVATRERPLVGASDAVAALELAHNVTASVRELS
jgi:predicted dehydrogenase